MKNKISAVVFLLFVLMNKVYAHQDFFRIKKFGKVTVRVRTGYNFEEINKAWIIGELTHRLLQKINCNDSLFLDFIHHYIGDCNPDYFIGYDKGELDLIYDTMKAVQASNEIVIRQVSSKFDIHATLNLVEFSVGHIDIITSQQKKFEYTKKHYRWRVNTIDTVITRNFSKIKLSSNIKEVLKQKIFLPEDIRNNISYYYQNGNYYIYANEPESTLIKLDDIYKFTWLKNKSAIVLDTDTSFYYIQISIPNYLSKRHIITTKRRFPWELFKPIMYNDSILVTDFEFEGNEPRLLRTRRGAFIIKENNGITPIDSTASCDGSPFVIVDDMPKFKDGGPENFRNYVNSNVKYPHEVNASSYMYRVFVSFVVNKYGRVVDAKIKKGGW